MFLAGFLAGIVNTLAGGASIFTLSTLLFFGLPATVANGTNRLGILVQNLTGAYTFHREGKLDLKGSLRFLIPSLLGAIIGAWQATDIEAETLELVVGLLMTGVLILMLFNPKRKYKVGSDVKKNESVAELYHLFRHWLLWWFRAGWNWYYHFSGSF